MEDWFDENKIPYFNEVIEDNVSLSIKGLGYLCPKYTFGHFINMEYVDYIIEILQNNIKELKETISQSQIQIDNCNATILKLTSTKPKFEEHFKFKYDMLKEFHIKQRSNLR